MIYDAKIAYYTLLSHFGLTLIAIGAAFTAIYISMIGITFNIETSLSNTPISTGYYFGKAMAISSWYLVFSASVMFIGGVIFAFYMNKLKG